MQSCLNRAYPCANGDGDAALTSQNKRRRFQRKFPLARGLALQTESLSDDEALGDRGQPETCAGLQGYAFLRPR